MPFLVMMKRRKWKGWISSATKRRAITFSRGGYNPLYLFLSLLYWTAAPARVPIFCGAVLGPVDTNLIITAKAIFCPAALSVAYVGSLHGAPSALLDKKWPWQ